MFFGVGGWGFLILNFDCVGVRDNEKGMGVSVLDDIDVVGVNFNNYSCDVFMRKLVWIDEFISVFSDW